MVTLLVVNDAVESCSYSGCFSVVTIINYRYLLFLALIISSSFLYYPLHSF